MKQVHLNKKIDWDEVDRQTGKEFMLNLAVKSIPFFVALAERLASENGGILPKLRSGEYVGLAGALRVCPGAFAHIKQQKQMLPEKAKE